MIGSLPYGICTKKGSDLTHPRVLQLLFYKAFPETHRLGCTDLQKHTLANPAQGLGGGGLKPSLWADFKGNMPAKF